MNRVNIYTVFVVVFLGSVLVLTACVNKTKETVSTGESQPAETTSEVSLDEIVACEEIIDDPTLMNTGGEKNWTVNDDGSITIGNGKDYYVRTITNKDNVTDVTYKHIEK